MYVMSLKSHLGELYYNPRSKCVSIHIHQKWKHKSSAKRCFDKLPRQIKRNLKIIEPDIQKE